MRKPRAEDLILPVVAVVAVAADQITKSLVVANLELGQSMDLVSWLAPIIRLTYITNTGVIFGLLPGLGDVFLVLAIVVVVVLLFYSRQLPPGQWLTRLGLGLQMGGALGNLTDRLVRGSVVDFFDLNFWPLREWAIFNIADASIVTGVILFGITLLWLEEEPEAQEAQEVQKAPALEDSVP